jgi:hypothetical protein
VGATRTFAENGHSPPRRTRLTITVSAMPSLAYGGIEYNKAIRKILRKHEVA